MKQYILKTVEGPAVNWNEIEVAMVDNYIWDHDYMPRVEARACVIAGKGIAARLVCWEKDPLRTGTKFYDDVYKDSCMEFFFGYRRGSTYVNCEMNANGAALIGVGDNRNGRIPLDQIITPPNVGAQILEDRWSVEVFFPLATLKAIFGDDAALDKGTAMVGNFYKCGDDCKPKHHGMWSPVTLAKPDFHRPEYFGEFVIG